VLPRSVVVSRPKRLLRAEVFPAVRAEPMRAPQRSRGVKEGRSGFALSPDFA
jgi:hypothetical protein